jgi:hypothetical protein
MVADVQLIDGKTIDSRHKMDSKTTKDVFELIIINVRTLTNYCAYRI